MLKVLLVCSVYMLTICHSENSFGLPINLNFDMQAVILNALNTSLGLLKEDYHQKINELKRDAMSCTINGSCLNILRKFEVRLFVRSLYTFILLRLKHRNNIVIQR